MWCLQRSLWVANEATAVEEADEQVIEIQKRQNAQTKVGSPILSRVPFEGVKLIKDIIAFKERNFACG